MLDIGTTEHRAGQHIDGLARLDPGILVDDGVDRPVEQELTLVAGEFVADVHDIAGSSPLRRSIVPTT